MYDVEDDGGEGEAEKKQDDLPLGRLKNSEDLDLGGSFQDTLRQRCPAP